MQIKKIVYPYINQNCYRYLGPRATTPVNITSNSQQLAVEAMNKPPHPNMFDNQQEGVSL